VRAPELVGADRHQIGAERVEVDRDVTGGLGRVDVDEDPGSATRGDHLGHRLQGADLVVSPLQVHERGATGLDGGHHLLRVDATGLVDTDPRHVVAVRRVTHRRVLDFRAHDVRTSLRRSPCRGVDGLGAAAREDDLAAAGAEQRRDLLARLLDDAAGDPSFRVHPARVGPAPELGEHRLHHGRTRGRRRRVIEVVPGAHTVVTHTSSPWGRDDVVSGVVSP